MNTPRKPLAAAFAACLLPAAATAAPCEMSDTVEKCRVRVEATALAAEAGSTVSMEAQRARARRELALQNTGSNPATSGNAGATINDFIAFFSASADSGSLSNDAQALVWEINLPTYTDAYKVTGKFTQPTLYRPLQNLVTDDTTARRLENELNDFDDFTLSLIYAPLSQRFGRSFAEHGALFDGAFNAAKARATPDRALFQKLNFEFQVFEENVENSIFDAGDEYDPEVTTFQEIAETTSPRMANELMEKLAQSVEARVSRRLALADALRETGVYSLPYLINNQPQLYVDLAGTARNDLVGPDEVRVSVTYELGWPNVNSFRRFQSSGRSGCSNEAECLGSFVKLAASPDRIQNGERLAVSLMYVDIAGYSFSRPELSLTLSESGSRKLIFGLSYGRYIRLLEAAGSAARFDLGVSYEDVSTDPNRQDRGLFNASLTQKITDGTDFTIGFIYATKPEFRGDVDRELSARAGFRYRFVQPE